MKLGEIDLKLKPIKHTLFLCKPDRTIIAPLKDVYDTTYSIKLGEVNELNFTIPAKVERDHQLVINPLIKKIKNRYLVKLEFNGQTDYLVLLEENKSFADNGESISYRMYSQGFLLADKTIRDYNAVSKPMKTILEEVLEETIWKVGFVDSYFDVAYRTHEIASQTVLQAVYEIAEKFNAVIIWDTLNFTIDFYNPALVGLNRGWKFKEGKYLESFNVTTNDEEITTRLKLYGKDGLTIRRLTPTGVNYLEDFSWFIYPFERDSSGNVIQSSDYMSDSLCIALDDYNKKLEEAQGAFTTYTEQLDIKYDARQQREQQLSVAETQLKTIQDELDVLNAAGDSDSPEHATALANKTTKETEVANHKSLLAGIIAEIAMLDANWNVLRDDLIIEANLSTANLIELNNYIIHKDYSNDTIIDEEDLLKEGMDAFNQARIPRVSLSMSIINFLSIVEAQNDWDKLNLGDIVTTESKSLDVEIQAKIIEIEYDFENDGINLVIANEQDIQNDESKWLDQLYNAGQTSTQVSMNKFKWDLIEETNGVISEMLNNVWDATQKGIVAGYKQDISINERGIVIKSPNNPMDLLVIQSGVIAISNDGGNTFKNAITRDGVIGDRIIGRIIMGTRLIIEDENGIIRFTGSLQEVFDDEGNVRVAIGEYEDGKYGIKIDNGALEIVGGLKEDHLDPLLVEDLKDDSKIREDLRLLAPLPTDITLNSQGITATMSTNANNFARLDYRGLYAQGGAVDIRTGNASNQGVIFDGNGIKGYNSAGTQTFSLNTNGYLNAQTGSFGGSLNAATGTFSGNLSAASGTFSGNLSAAGGTFTGTLNGVDGTFTGSISANQITSGGTISGVTLDVSNAGASSDGFSATSIRFWAGSSFSGRASAPFRVNQSGAVYASNLNITGGSIDVSSDVKIGSRLIIGSGSAEKRIEFGGNAAWIYSYANNLFFDTGYINVLGTLRADYLETSTLFNAGVLNLQGGVGSLRIKSSSGGETLIQGSSGSETVLKWSATGLEVRTANNSAYASISASAFVVNSERKVKNNILKAESMLGKVKNTNTYSYLLNTPEKGRENQRHLGLILDEAPSEIQSDVGIDLYAMNTMLWKAVQELSDQVDDLSEQLKKEKKPKK